MLSNHYKEMYDEINKESVNSKEVFDLVHDYLVHSGFVGTLHAFEDESSFALIQKEQADKDNNQDKRDALDSSSFNLRRKNTMGPDMAMPLTARNRRTGHITDEISSHQGIEESKEEHKEPEKQLEKKEEVKDQANQQPVQADQKPNGKLFPKFELLSISSPIKGVGGNLNCDGANNVFIETSETPSNENAPKEEDKNEDKEMEATNGNNEKAADEEEAKEGGAQQISEDNKDRPEGQASESPTKPIDTSMVKVDVPEGKPDPTGEQPQENEPKGKFLKRQNTKIHIKFRNWEW